MANDAAVVEKSKRAKTGNGHVPALGDWMGGFQAMESWAESSSAMMKSSFEMAQAMLTFSQSRMRADIDACKALAACRNPADLIECQKEFAEKAATQYLDEANKLASHVMGIVSSAASRFGSLATKT